ncbi:MAG: DUF1465 family protein [Alphaproteobacteria bacterium]|nr:DUF1465 family protein [Alphaproteobacteria bacterium]
MMIDLNFIELRIRNANALLKETHDYIKWQAPSDIEYMSRDDIFKLSCEVMRVTVRITRIIGWLVLQKAILDGEFSREDNFSDKSRILKGKSGRESPSENDFQLPQRLRELLKKSRILYEQTMRLEEISLQEPPSSEEIKKMGIKGCHAVPPFYLKKKTNDSG